ncbi:DUF4340 domain-containing protein [Candidatus Parabeggiatoa sp. HSG14]|uniref:DUF4340 domain-containing protein n=1 Tax=Candidatus Parabeggiatoa sp. HSG14 TaxID=3055593 RepID=UPI0025A79978|nr:DUF4340 domain-containing protein [Thiotrichales bacterium HSG14]
MNAKNFSILTVITIVVVVAAVLLTQQKTTTITEKGKFFPQLESVVNDVTEINVMTNDKSMTMNRGEDWQWQLKEKQGYPVETAKVNDLLLGAVHLMIREAKTSNPKLYSKIGVEDVSEDGAKSTLVTFKKKEGETVASVIIGNDRVSKGDSTQREIYVRKSNDKQAWLTVGQFSIEKNPSDWLDKSLVDLDSDNVRQVRVTHSDGESFLVFKDTPKDEDYQLADLPENGKIEQSYTLENIATTLTGLSFDDVTVASDVDFEKGNAISTIFTTFDGLEVTMTTVGKDDKRYAKFVAAFNPSAVWVEPPKTEDEAKSEQEEGKDSAKTEEKDDDSKKEEPKEDAKTRAEKLNAKLGAWAYELSKYKVDDLEKKRDDLISIEEPVVEEELAAEVSPFDESADLPPLFTPPMNLPSPFKAMPMEDLPSSFGTPSTATD